MSIRDLMYTVISSDQELKQILALQEKNIPASITQTEKEKEGFVTVQHNLKILKKMNDHQPHIIAKDDDQVIGYTLCMLKEFKNDIQVLKPMFSKIDEQLEPHISYVIMGQVCIDKKYRGQGVFRELYQTMKTALKENYDLLITEVASDNLRSLHAHYAIGFKTLLVYKTDATEWHLICWDWT